MVIFARGPSYSYGHLCLQIWLIQAGEGSAGIGRFEFGAGHPSKRKKIELLKDFVRKGRLLVIQHVIG